MYALNVTLAYLDYSYFLYKTSCAIYIHKNRIYMRFVPDIVSILRLKLSFSLIRSCVTSPFIFERETTISA